MVHHHRSMIIPHLLLRKPDVESQTPHLQPLVYSDLWSATRKSKLTLLRLFFLFSLLSCSLLFAPRLLPLLPPSDQPLDPELSTAAAAPCSSMANDSICCDRTAFRTDLCFMRGDVRTNGATNSLFLLSHSNSTAGEEKIRPYTRKWETSVMSTIDELTLSTVTGNLTAGCDVRHDVPAVVFSTGGYTGNVYHEFNDGLIPLYITSRHFNKQVVFVILEYHDWWITKYANVLSLLSDYPPVDFSGDRRTHCFPAATVGLRIHDELSIDPAKMADNRTIADFRRMLDDAYKPRIEWINQEEEQNKTTTTTTTKKPKLVIVSRNGSRSIENEGEVARLAAGVGFRVEVLRPERTTELARIYKAMNASDAMVGVHGAAMTHFLFMRPGSVFIQIVPLGTDWAAEAYYGEPAAKLGLRYMRYGILARESSLHREYEKGDPVLRDPESVNARGWETTKKVYLDGQKVRLDLGRFRKRLVRAHQYLVAKQGGKRSQQ